MSFIEELKRRNVFRVGIGYGILAWLIAQVADLFMEAFGAPEWALKSLLIVLLLGFPIALFFAWAFELTPDGIKREADVDRAQSITRKTGRGLDRAIIGVLALALGYFVWDKFSTGETPSSDPTQAEAAPAENPAAGAPADAIALPTDASIAVLPFENRSQRVEDEHFSSGIHDDLLTQLAQIGSLRVISRTSVAQFKDTTLSVREIAETLGVSTILEGGVQRSGDQVRINMQLIDAATDAHLWAETFDRELTASNVFSIQSEVAGAVSDALRLTLTPDEQERMGQVPTENLAALELYFKGRLELDERTLPAITSARMRFEEARRLDPSFALAWAGEALAIVLLVDGGTSYGDIPRTEAMAMARPLMEQAFALAPEDPQVLGAYGLLERTDLENDAALDYFRRSLDTNPSSGEVLNWQRMSQANAGLWEASLASADRMVEVDPMSKIALYNASASFVNTPYDDGERVEQLLDRLEGLDRSYGVAARGLVANYRGQVLEAIRQYFTVIELDPGRVSARDRLAGLLLELGLVEEAMQIDPRRDELDEAFARGEWEHGLALAQAQFEQDPDSFENLFDLLYVRVRSSDRFEDALPLVTASAAGMENAGIRFAPLYLTMARIAQLADAPAEARQLRDQGVELLQRQIDAGVSSTWVELSRLMLSVIDGDTESALQALEASMELGYRDRFLADNALLQPLWDDLQFQAEVARMNQLIEQERVQVAAMLCGPDRIVQSYQPAPETCALYPGS